MLLELERRLFYPPLSGEQLHSARDGGNCQPDKVLTLQYTTLACRRAVDSGAAGMRSRCVGARECDRFPV